MPDNYFLNLSPEQKRNVGIIVARMQRRGLTNPFSQAAALSVDSKETGFIPHFEDSYAHTPNDRIRAIFPTRLGHLTDDQLNALKANDYDFFNAIYGGRLGNAPNEGYKYRGGGFNEITGKDAYRDIGNKIGVDLVNHPEKINEPEIAADAMVQYFLDQFKDVGSDRLLKQYHSVNINGFKNINDAVNAFYQANKGWNNQSTTPTESGYQLARARVAGFLDLVKKK